MIRNVLGSVFALVGAAIAVLSPFRHWYGGRLGRHYGILDPFTGITSGRPGLLGSILAFFLFTALLTLIGVVLRSRSLVAVAGVLVLGFTVLWMVRQGQTAGGLGITTSGSGLRWGVAGAAVGGVLTLLGAAMMAGRRGGRRPVPEGQARPYTAPGSEHPDTWPPTQEPGPSAQTSTLPEPEADPYTGPDRDPREGPRPGPHTGPHAGPNPHAGEDPYPYTGPDEGPGPGPGVGPGR
ncbi:hypothetical protein [Streptomyces sp. NPDC052042]|uniref:hypothetical protein n=1 Tax=Streptomyces sp. NPDC052042 TaxID=3365683 RepID=UPI0037D8CB65